MAKQRSNGFTLIEILVVIVIISSLVGLAVFAIGSKPQKDQLERESMRLQSILRWTLDEALFQNNEWGINISENTYTFYRLNNKKKWEKVDTIKDADKTELKGLFEHKLPEHMWIKAQIEGDDKWVVDSNEANVSDSDSPGLSGDHQAGLSSNTQQTIPVKAPPILLLSSGEYTPFIIDIGLEGSEKPLFSIYGDGVGDIKLAGGDDIEKIHRP